MTLGPGPELGPDRLLPRDLSAFIRNLNSGRGGRTVRTWTAALRKSGWGGPTGDAE